MRCGVVCGVVWCYMVWCGVVWCLYGVVLCLVPSHATTPCMAQNEMQLTTHHEQQEMKSETRQHCHHQGY